MKALVIDDSSATRFILGKLMKELGFQVSEAVDGKDGRERLAANPDTDLVLVDWNMPVMNGLEFVTAVRADSKFKAVKLMMVTTEIEMMNVVKALDAGANEYVMKPFTKEILQEKVKLLGFTVPS